MNCVDEHACRYLVALERAMNDRLRVGETEPPAPDRLVSTTRKL